MTTSLYDLSVGCYLQTVGAVVGILDRGLRHCEETGASADDLVSARLFQDMAPLSFQVVSVVHHSIEAVEGLKTGWFGPPTTPQPTDYASLQKLAAEAHSALTALNADDVNALSGKDITFAVGDMKLPFTAENFILSFSLPNLHFHATTTYDILRNKGVPLGKRNYMGALRMKV